LKAGDMKAISPQVNVAAVLTRWLIPLLGLLGMGISGYLSFAYLSGEEPLCLFGSSGCSEVITSRYSHILGVPLPVLGLAMYSVLTSLSLIAIKLRGNIRPFLMLSIYAIALSGTLYSVFLTYLQFSVLQSLCTWCLGSALVVISIFLLSLGGLFEKSPP
jgi:uncharacterized membrane protein